MTDYAHIAVAPLTGSVGAEVSGVDASDDLCDAVIGEIRQALLDHGVIFLRGQNLTPDRHKAFARRFGPLNIDKFVKGPPRHPEIMPVVKEAHDTGNFAGMWHTDVTFLDEPALGSILYAREVPDFGGDTLFANMALAYETLSPGMQALLDGLRAVHCADVTYDRARMDEANRTGGAMTYTELDPSQELSVHPVVRTHPETGRKSLFVNCAYTRCFENMTVEESKPLLDFLYQHLSRIEFTCRFRWSTGALAFWDNRAVQHLPINDYAGRRREMHRVTIAGDKPF
jgi:taurine dioxygenase